MIAAVAKAPHIDWAALSPIVALFGGAIAGAAAGPAAPALRALHAGAARSDRRRSAPRSGSRSGSGTPRPISCRGALRIDGLALVLMILIFTAGIATVLLSWRAAAPVEAAHGEYFALLLTSIAGMALLVESQNTVTLFVAFELLSIPLYVLCATEMRRATSLESGLKYLIVGSVGSATLVYGLSLLYGASGSTDFTGIAQGVIKQGTGDRRAVPHRHRPGAHRASPSRPASRRSTSGRPMSTRARRRRSRRSWRWRRRRRRSASSCASSTSR